MGAEVWLNAPSRGAGLYEALSIFLLLCNHSACTAAGAGLRPNGHLRASFPAHWPSQASSRKIDINLYIERTRAHAQKTRRLRRLQVIAYRKPSPQSPRRARPPSPGRITCAAGRRSTLGTGARADYSDDHRAAAGVWGGPAELTAYRGERASRSPDHQCAILKESTSAGSRSLDLEGFEVPRR